jgi:hypothetical protein
VRASDVVLDRNRFRKDPAAQPRDLKRLGSWRLWVPRSWWASRRFPGEADRRRRFPAAVRELAAMLRAGPAPRLPGASRRAQAPAAAEALKGSSPRSGRANPGFRSPFPDGIQIPRPILLPHRAVSTWSFLSEAQRSRHRVLLPSSSLSTSAPRPPRCSSVSSSSRARSGRPPARGLNCLCPASRRCGCWPVILFHRSFEGPRFAAVASSRSFTRARSRSSSASWWRWRRSEKGVGIIVIDGAWGSRTSWRREPARRLVSAGFLVTVPLPPARRAVVAGNQTWPWAAFS